MDYIHFGFMGFQWRKINLSDIIENSLICVLKMIGTFMGLERHEND